VVKETGPQFENMLACHLLKWCLHIQDAEGRDIEPRDFRDIDIREVDFVVVEDGALVLFVKAKASTKEARKSIRYLREKFPSAKALQVVLSLDDDWRGTDGIRTSGVQRFLNELP
jgi:uncharacterized protein